ncbi:MAG: hypothetical protein WA116_04845 [Anaerolineaceae bacterium]
MFISSRIMHSQTISGTGHGLQHFSGFLWFTPYNGSGSGNYLQVAGYPQDKDEYGKQMWFGLASPLHSEPFFTYYDNDTIGSNSGAPVWEFGNPTC